MIHTLFTPSLTPVANCHKSDCLGHVWPFPESLVSPAASPVTSRHASRVSIIIVSPCAVLKCFAFLQHVLHTEPPKKVRRSFSHWADGHARAHRRANAHGRRHLSMGGGRICVVSTQRDTENKLHFGCCGGCAVGLRQSPQGGASAGMYTSVQKGSMTNLSIELHHAQLQEIIYWNAR